MSETKKIMNSNVNTASLLNNTTNFSQTYNSYSIQPTVETIDLTPSPIQTMSDDELRNAGYNYYLNGSEIPNIEWNEENTEIWNQGMQSAYQELHNRWQNIGYRFISEGEIMPSLDTPYYDSDSTRLAIMVDGMQIGINNALREGNVVDPNNIPPLTVDIADATPEQVNLETYRRLLNENWYNLGIDSAKNINILDRVSSVYDNYFQSRNMSISASSIINAGRNSVENND